MDDGMNVGNCLMIRMPLSTIFARSREGNCDKGEFNDEGFQVIIILDYSYLDQYCWDIII